MQVLSHASPTWSYSASVLRFALNPEAFVSMLLCQVSSALHCTIVVTLCNRLRKVMLPSEAIAMFGVRTFAIGQVPKLFLVAVCCYFTLLQGLFKDFFLRWCCTLSFSPGRSRFDNERALHNR